MSTTDERTQLVMRHETFEELRLHAQVPSATALPEHAAALKRALWLVKPVDGAHVRVSCDASALEFIRSEAPEIARLWPAVFGDAPVPRARVVRARVVVSIAPHVIGQTVSGVQSDADGALRLEFESGAALIVSADGNLAWRHGG